MTCILCVYFGQKLLAQTSKASVGLVLYQLFANDFHFPTFTILPPLVVSALLPQLFVSSPCVSFGQNSTFADAASRPSCAQQTMEQVCPCLLDTCILHVSR